MVQLDKKAIVTAELAVQSPGSCFHLLSCKRLSSYLKGNLRTITIAVAAKAFNFIEDKTPRDRTAAHIENAMSLHYLSAMVRKDPCG